MAAQNILLVGATGETGGDVLNGLTADGSFKITALIRPVSASKPSVQALKERGVSIAIIDLKASIPVIASEIIPYDTIISAIGPGEQLEQLALVDAAAQAGTCKRFIPCGFTTVCPPGDVMKLRDFQESVYQRVWAHKVPYTFIDVGYWFQISWPRVPSGSLDYALLIPGNTVYGSGDVKTLLIDKRDIGVYVAKIIKDGRTLNKRVLAHGEELSQNEIIHIVEKATGEKVETNHISEKVLYENRSSARAALAAGTAGDQTLRGNVYQSDYIVSKFVRGDNTAENAKYLGYLDTRDLYPDVKARKFVDFVRELVDGKGERPYSHLLG